MNTLDQLLLVAACVLCGISAFWSPPRVHLGWLGLALLIFSMLPVP